MGRGFFLSYYDLAAKQIRDDNLDSFINNRHPHPFLLSHLLYACQMPDTASLWVYQVEEIECCLSPGGAGSLVMETDM